MDGKEFCDCCGADLSAVGSDDLGCPACLPCWGQYNPGTEECDWCLHDEECHGFAAETQGSTLIPKRIQRQRTRGWKMPPDTVYVGRPTKWGNPHSVKDYRFESADMNRHAAVRDFYCDLIGGQLEIRREDVVSELKGKNLACWCREDDDCHADVLLKIANKEK